MERTPSYQMRTKTWPLNQGARGAHRAHHGHRLDGGGGEPARGREQVIYYNCGVPGHYT